jgi:hypothetical protein
MFSTPCYAFFFAKKQRKGDSPFSRENNGTNDQNFAIFMRKNCLSDNKKNPSPSGRQSIAGRAYSAPPDTMRVLLLGFSEIIQALPSPAPLLLA